MEVSLKEGASRLESIAEEVYRHVRDVAKGQLDWELTPQTSLYEVGLDSLARMEVINRLEEAFSIRFREESLYDLETCRDLFALIAEHLSVSLEETANEPANVPEDGAVPPIAPEHGGASQPDATESDVTQFAEVVGFDERLALAAAAGLQSPFFRVSDGVQGAVATIGGRQAISYTSFDYLGMAGDPRVAAAAKEAIDRFGTSASASRLVGGNSSILQELDDEIASFLGAEAATVFPSGYGTNASLLGHLFGKEDMILYDELSHNSIVQGSLLSPARKRPFPHNDFAFVDRLLADVRGKYRRVVIAIEGVYSMDGDYPDLPEFIEVKNRRRALLYVDEAHSIGVMGPSGRGICEHFGIDPVEGDLWMGTISKALGSGGGYMAGRAPLIEYLKYTTPSFVFATACSPANAAAALAAVRIARLEPQRVARLKDRAILFARLACDAGLDIGNSHDTPIVPVILGDSLKCVQISHALLRHGIDAQPILYPAVPEKAARIRFFITAKHTEDQICQTVEVLARCLDGDDRALAGSS